MFELGCQPANIIIENPSKLFSNFLKFFCQPCSPNPNLLALTHPKLPGCQPAKIFDVRGFLGLCNPNPKS